MIGITFNIDHYVYLEYSMNWCAIALVLLIIFAVLGFYFLTTGRENYQAISVDNKSDIPVAELFDIIKNNFLDPSYHYNLQSHPKRRLRKYGDYEDYVEDHIQTWNELFDRDILEYEGSKLIYGEVAGNEFFLNVDVYLEYNDRDFIANITLYGDKQPNGDTAIQLTKLDVRED